MNFNIDNLDKNSINSEIKSIKIIDNENQSYISSFLSFTNKKYYITKIKIIISLIAFTIGLMDVIDLSVYYYQKDKLHISPSTMNLIDIVIKFPWCIKPIFGFISDKIRLKLGGIKSILLIISLFDFLFTVSVYIIKPNIFFFLLLITMHNICEIIEIIIAETLLVIISKHQLKEGLDNQSGNNISLFFGYRSLGSIFGNLFSGYIIKKFSIELPFLISSCISLIWFIIIFNYKEIIFKNNINNNHQNSIIGDIKKIISIIKSRNIIFLLVVIFLIDCAPDFNPLIMYYFTNKLKFTSIELSYFTTIGTICCFLGIIAYNIFFKNLNQRTFFICTNFILLLSSIFYFILLGGFLNSNYNIKRWCFLNQGFSTFISEINFFPILIILLELCPDNLEGSSFAFFSSIFNFSSIVSNYFGFFVLYILKIDQKNLEEIWKPLCVQNIYYFIFIMIVIFLNFPKTIQISNNTKNNDNKNINMIN